MYGLFDKIVRFFRIDQTSSVIMSLRFAAAVFPNGLKIVRFSADQSIEEGTLSITLG